jgi:hypothetical protein
MLGYINYVSKYGALFILLYTDGKIVNLELMFSSFPLPLYIILSLVDVSVLVVMTSLKKMGRHNHFETDR